MTKYSVDLILWSEVNPDNFQSIYIRITIDRKQRYISSGFRISKKHWHPATQTVTKGQDNYKTINTAISTRKAEILAYIVKQEVLKLPITAQAVKDHFTGHDQHNLFTFLESFIKEVKNKREPGTLENYRKHLLKLEQFHGSQNLTFEQITPEFLLRYETYLRATVGNNYITALWKTLKTIFNAAIKKGLITYYPFNQYENPVYVAPQKDHLTMPELKLFEEFTDNTINPILKQCAVYFLFGCYSGLRISDWYQFDFDKHIKGSFLRLRPVKTKKKWVEMIISKPLERNLLRMRQIPLTLKEPVINRNLKIIAKKLGINKRLTTHRGRGTFAITICLGNKLSSETAAELMGITLDTFVKNYSEVTQEKINRETAEGWKNLV